MLKKHPFFYMCGIQIVMPLKILSIDTFNIKIQKARVELYFRSLFQYHQPQLNNYPNGLPVMPFYFYRQLLSSIH